MARARPLLAVLAILAPLVLAGSTWGASPPARILVGYDAEDEQAARLAILAAGGSVRRASAELAFAVVETSDPERFRSLVAMSPHVRYVEDDSPTRLNGAQWNGAQWNNMRNDGAQWNGAQWNAQQWTKRYHDRSGDNWEVDLATTDPGLVWQWGSWAAQAPSAWMLAQGTRTARLCVLDSGVAWDHPDLAPNTWTGPLGERGWNAIDPAASAYDDAGHGTHVAGIAAGAVGNGYGVAGVGNALILPVKVLDASGQGAESDLAFGLVWCASQGADVVVMALSASEPGPTLDRALAYLAARDALMLASVGNDGDDRVNYPANDPRVLGVAALDGDLHPAAFSDRGSEVDLAAPGVHILGPLPGNVFAFGSGTSQAVAIAAGMAALLRDSDPTLSAPQAAEILVRTARDLAAAGPDASTGAGILRVDLGIQAALS